MIHGHPGTGKSQVIKWLNELFTDILKWKHGNEFIFVAFQNKMASLIGGMALHGAADLPHSEDA